MQSSREAVPGAVCVVVDDGSTDATARVAGEADAVVLRLPFNLADVPVVTKPFAPGELVAALLKALAAAG